MTLSQMISQGVGGEGHCDKCELFLPTISRERFTALSSYRKTLVTDMSYLSKLVSWFMCLLQEDSQNFTFQQDRTPPHCH